MNSVGRRVVTEKVAQRDSEAGASISMRSPPGARRREWRGDAADERRQRGNLDPAGAAGRGQAAVHARSRPRVPKAGGAAEDQSFQSTADRRVDAEQRGERRGAEPLNGGAGDAAPGGRTRN